ncbi:hypothetical protein E0E50_10755 [Azotobacter chroococcum subsp. isscasi]|uniref:hypothetical protein n=1 Tax=Azotobacter chroococcum TaxID=353 RepID=UPI0010392F4E|nr:hypothetical protein [Azotobacter chroococcum]TBW10014.1 hypothetical protein E0E50_10755 [Azotobacter chroococcum subsp. isscasi]
MSKRERPIEMGNLVCKFGAQNLLDYFHTIVYPAFFDTELIRKYGDTKYFFNKVELITIDGRVLLVGRFIKDMILEREQVYNPAQGLVEDHEELQSSPSAIFVLILDIHRLIYLKETKFAPTLDNFKSTIESFIKAKHKEYIDRLADESKVEGKVEGKRKTKKQLLSEHLPPSLEIIPLTSARSVEDFVRQYEILSSVTYKFSDRNDEQDNEGFFRAVQRQKDEVGSKSTTIKHLSPEGLDKEAVIGEVQAATAQGNQRVVMVGKDSLGNTLRGDNNDFQLKTTIEVSSHTPSRVARNMFSKFLELVGDGLIQVGVPTKEVLAKLAPYRDDDDNAQ